MDVGRFVRNEQLVTGGDRGTDCETAERKNIGNYGVCPFRGSTSITEEC